jgi:hypothetical protein
VSTHQLVPKPTNDFDDILTMATTKTTSKSNPNAHLTINSIMSTPTLESKVHETHYERTDYGLEAFVHTMRIGDVDYEVESDHDDDFSDTQEARLAQFDYSAYREEPTPTQIDLLDDVSFLVDREQLNPEPESTETPTTVRLHTKEDLIQFHEDPQAEANEFPRPKTPPIPNIDPSTFEDIEESSPTTRQFDLSACAIEQTNEPLDLTKYLLTDDTLDLDEEVLNQTIDFQWSMNELCGIEESKDYEKPYEGYQGMMKSPYQFVHKPPPTTSKIVLNEDKTKHIFVKGDNKLPPLEPIPPAISDDTPEIVSQPFDISQYIDHPEYIDDPNPFFPDPTIPPDEPKFYEKPTVETEFENDDTIWELTTSKRKRKKKKSKGTSPSVLSDSSPSSQSETSSTANPKKDFRYAGSD